MITKILKAMYYISLVLVFAVLASVTINIFGCTGYITPVNVTDDTNVGDCAAACENLARLKCPGWEGSPGPDGVFGTKDDASCTEVCVHVTSDPFSTLCPRCTAEAENCDQIDRCFEQ